MSGNNSINESMLNEFAVNFERMPKNHFVMNATVKNGIKAAALNFKTVQTVQHHFSEEIKTGKITDQKNSGRCWIFAGLNTLRQEIKDRYNLKSIELSQNFIMFYDKLEKSNYFLQSIIRTFDEPLDSRIVAWILSEPVQDGGQWDMFCNIVNKYGVVPKEAMPESFNSSKSDPMNSLLSKKLRENAYVLRKMHNNKKSENEIYAAKNKMLNEVYRMLCCFLGVPPKKFTFEYTDKDDKYICDNDITPIEFYKKYVSLNLDDYISIINAPTNDKPFYKTYTVDFLGNVIGGKKVKYLNVDINIMKKLASAQIKDKKSVWFGCDVDQMFDYDSGILDSNMYCYDEAFDIKLGLNKAQRLDYRDSCLTHAMVLTGVNINNGIPNRWKVENSWGDEKADKGYLVMSDSWFEDYLYQIVINKKYIPEKLLDAYKTEPIVLQPWDPMGSLAYME